MLNIGQVRLRTRPQIGPWVTRAACTGLHPDLFHPERGDPTKEAKAVCATCPVRRDCLEYALASDQQYGIWGGLSERGRRLVRVADPTIVTESECPCCGDLFRPRTGQRFCTIDCRNYHRSTQNRRS